LGKKMKSLPRGIVHTDYIKAAERLHKKMPLLSFQEWGIILEAMACGLDPADCSEDSYRFSEAANIVYNKLMKEETK